MAALQATGVGTALEHAGHDPPAQAGQLPFSPPDVSGWGENEYWLSTSKLWGRSQWATYVRYYAWQAGVSAGRARP